MSNVWSRKKNKQNLLNTQEALQIFKYINTVVLLFSAKYYDNCFEMQEDKKCPSL